MILDPNQTFVDKAQRLTSWGHWFTFFNILVALLISSGFIITDVSPTTALGFSYLVTNWIGHTAFITFVCFVLTIFPISMIFPYPRHIRGVSALIASSGMILLTIDAYSYSRLGYHISGASFGQVATLLTNTWNDHPVRSFMWLFGSCSLILVVELVISNFTWKQLERLKRRACGARLTIFFLTAFVLSHLIHIWADATFDYDVTKQNNMFPFSYPATAKTLLAKNGLLDRQQHQTHQANHLSLQQNLDFYPSHQPRQCHIKDINNDLVILLTGNLDKTLFAQLADLKYTRFDKHYVPTNNDDAVFNLLYGLPSVYKNSIIANRQRPQWIDIAQKHGLSVELDISHALSFAGYRYLSDDATQSASQSNTDGSKKIILKQMASAELTQYIATLGGSNVIIVSTSDSPDSPHKMAITKTPLLVKWSSQIRYRGQVSQNLDINSTIIQSWLNCQPVKETAAATQPLDIFGKNILRKQPKVLAANYTDGTIVSIHKDKITLLDIEGNSRTISATNGYQLNQEADIPTLNDTIHLLKRYSVSVP